MPLNLPPDALDPKRPDANFGDREEVLDIVGQNDRTARCGNRGYERVSELQGRAFPAERVTKSASANGSLPRYIPVLKLVQKLIPSRQL